jgi:hypothetical protein
VVLVVLVVAVDLKIHMQVDLELQDKVILVAMVLVVQLVVVAVLVLLDKLDQILINLDQVALVWHLQLLVHLLHTQVAEVVVVIHQPLVSVQVLAVLVVVAKEDFNIIHLMLGKQVLPIVEVAVVLLAVVLDQLQSHQVLVVLV